MKEVWKDIPGYEGKYQASTLGRIRSLKFKGKKRMLIRKIIITKNGRTKIDLINNDGTRRWTNVGRLVLEAFVGKSNLTVHHIDKNPLNNRLDNLKYLSIKDNVRATECTPVKSINRETGEIKHYEALRDVKKDGFSMRNVWLNLNGKTKSSYNCWWKYEDIK
jgi:hypothetical protein